MCQLVVRAVVPASMIQPLRPFGRPGSLTRNQRRPLLSGARPMTGSTVCSPVIGRTDATTLRRVELRWGARRTVCGTSSTSKPRRKRSGCL
jgi:hypothetical protein